MEPASPHPRPGPALALAFALAACDAPAAVDVGAPAAHPNVVVILADDLGWGDVACYWPDSKIPTPNLDRLAGQGMRFTDAHSPSAVCSPTRYGLLTGRYAWRTWLQSSVLWSFDPPLIEADRPTLPAFLGARGYATACVGKWHLGWDWPTVGDGEARHGSAKTNLSLTVDYGRPVANGPLARGFDHYFGDDVPNFPPYVFIEDDRTVGIPSVAKPDALFGAPGLMLPGWELDAVMPAITRRAVEWIGEVADEGPFFLYMPLTAPHTPIAPAEEFRGQSEAGLYGDFVHQVDHTVGQVMAALEEAGVAGDTLLVFTSDNGSPARNGAGWSGPVGSVVRDHGHRPSGPWRGTKADIWEGGHRVPFIARWPGVVAPGSTSGEVICHTDLFATIASALGEELPAGAAGDSWDLLPVLRGEERDAPVREATVHHSSRGVFAIRQGRWKLILGLGSGGWTKPTGGKPGPGGPPAQLYDLAADPGETTNLYPQEPEVVASLAQLLKRYRDGERSAPRGQ